MEPYDAAAINNSFFSQGAPEFSAIKQEPMHFDSPFSMLPEQPQHIGSSIPEYLSGASSGNSSPMSGSGRSDAHELDFPQSPAFMQGDGVSTDPYDLDTNYGEASDFSLFANVKLEHPVGGGAAVDAHPAPLQQHHFQRGDTRDQSAGAPPSKRSKSTGGKPKGRGKAKAKAGTKSSKPHGNSKAAKAALAAQVAAAAAAAAAAIAVEMSGGASPAHNGSSSGSAGEERDDDDFEIPPFDETGMTQDEIKKKKRMLKNRLSASLSRKRKKEYVEGLEGNVAALVAENTKLKTRLAARSGGADGSASSLKKENAMYKTKCEMLQRENEQLKMQLAGRGSTHGFTGTPMRTGGTALMACLLCFGLFANPFAAPATNGMVHSAANTANGNGNGGAFNGKPSLMDADAGLHFTAAPAHARKYGRTLKTVEINEVAAITPNIRQQPEESSSEVAGGKRRQPTLLTAGKLHAPIAVPPAPRQEGKNAQAEEQTLEGWIAANEARVVSQLNLTLPPVSKPPGIRGRGGVGRVGGPNSVAAASTELELAREIERSEGAFDSGNPWQLPPPYTFEGFDNTGAFPGSVAATIQRRADTSYLFCSQVHMVAAIDADENEKPKLAIVMPASKIPDHVLQSDGNSTTEGVTPVLQVDCDVTGTKVVQTVRSGPTTTKDVTV